jgi:hypothetical protein
MPETKKKFFSGKAIWRPKLRRHGYIGLLRSILRVELAQCGVQFILLRQDAHSQMHVLKVRITVGVHVTCLCELWFRVTVQDYIAEHVLLYNFKDNLFFSIGCKITRSFSIYSHVFTVGNRFILQHCHSYC